MDPTVDEAPRKSVDHYTLLQVLGRGLMGTVFQARNERNAEQVALKRFNDELRDDQEARDRFLREIDILRDLLGHEHIVSILDRSWTGESMYLVMEYCNAGSVEALVKKHTGRVPLPQALSITYQVLAGLEWAHTMEVRSARAAGRFAAARGIVHRDIKPSNILLHNDCGVLTAKIGDFGLAKTFELAGLTGLTRSGTLGGTSLYMPRQQLIDFKRAGPAVDLWATVATLYYMLTGLPPRDILPMMTRQEVEQVIYDTSPVPIRKRMPNVPDALSDVIDDALNDRQKELPLTSAAKLKTALQRAASA